MEPTDSYDLERFVVAQAPVFDTALGELKAGRKRTHWMWFVFPQMRGLGRTEMATRYGIGSLDEARAYLAHPVLGPRLILCTRAVLEIPERSLNAIFGAPDDMKFHSSMTLYALAAPDAGSLFRQAIDLRWDGRMDDKTLELLRTTDA